MRDGYPAWVVGLAVSSSGCPRSSRACSAWVAGRSFRVVQLDDSRYMDVAEPQGSDYTNVVQLDRSQYTEVH